jgi:hypothetical protein
MSYYDSKNATARNMPSAPAPISRKTLTWILAAVSLLLAAVIIIIIIVTGGGAGEPAPSASTSASPSASDALIKNGDFNKPFITSPIADYPLAPAAWTAELKSKVENDGTSTGLYTRFGIVDTAPAVFNALDEGQIGSIAPIASAGGANPDQYNPGTPETVDKTKILMLYSKLEAGIQYKSTSFYIDAGECAEISVWIKTYGLTANNAGAAIKLLSADETVKLEYELIDTEAAVHSAEKDANGWVNYKFYVSTNATSGQTVYLYLSLGYETKGTGGENNLMSGYAFFADAKMTYISKTKYSDAEVVADDDANPKKDYIKYYKFKTDTNNQIEKTEDFSDSAHFTFKNPHGAPVVNAPIATAADNYGIIPLSSNFQTAPLDFFKDHPFASTGNALMLHNESLYSIGYGYAYDSGVLFTARTPLKYYRIGIWVKTSEMAPGTGANIYLIGTNKNAPYDKKSVAFENIDTTTLTAKAYNSGWSEFVFYVQSSLTDEYDFTIEFWLGKRHSAETDANKAKGYAFFTDMSVGLITLYEYQSASSSSTSKTLSISAANTTTITNGTFDTPLGNDLVNYPLAPSDWQTYYSGHTSLTNMSEGGYVTAEGNKRPPIAYGDWYSGVINVNYAEDTFDAIGGDALTYFTAYSDFKSYFEPGSTGPNVLMIFNTVKTGNGYVSPTTTFAAGSYYKVSVKVKTKFLEDLGGGGGANIYLNGMNETEIEAAEQFNGIDTERFLADALAGTKLLYDKDTDFFKEISLVENDYIEFTFLVRTGGVEKIARLELWLGGRAYSLGGLTEGFAFFDAISIKTVTEDDFNGYIEKLKSTAYENIQVVDYSEDEAPEEDLTDETDTEDEATPGTPFDWLMFSTLVIAVALLAAIGATLYRKIRKNLRRAKKMQISSDYKRKPAGRRAKTDSGDNGKTAPKTDGDITDAKEDADDGDL